MLSEDVLYLPVAELAKKIRAREVSPVELAESYLARLERLGPKLNAVATLTRERGLEEARAAEREIAAGYYRGPLHGIPYGGKDLLATRGIPTTWGAPPYRNQVFDYDATVIERLRAAGAVLIAKLAMVELAGSGGYRYASASATGPGLNPWNTGTWSGGSSSGSGAATAAALVAFAIGSETWGSILTPSSFCGVTGLRPSYGRVSRYGAMAVSWTLDKLGPMCRAVDDCGLVLAALAGYDPNDASTLPGSFTDEPLRGDLRHTRIGVVPEDFAKNAEPEVERAFNAALEVLGGFGAELEPAPLPAFPYAPVAETVIAAEAAAFFEELIQTGKVGELVDVAQQAGIEAGAQVKAVDYLKAMQLRTLLQAEFARLFEKFEVLVAPSLLFVASPIEADLNTVFKGSSGIGAAGNLLGLPAISVPCGFGKNNLPAGLSVVGKPLDEAAVLRVARAYQQATNWHTRRPPIA
ncbi:MAG: amidase [Terriglobia bacterium]